MAVAQVRTAVSPFVVRRFISFPSLGVKDCKQRKEICPSTDEPEDHCGRSMPVVDRRLTIAVLLKRDRGGAWSIMGAMDDGHSGWERG